MCLHVYRERKKQANNGNRNLYQVKALGSECPCAKKHKERPARTRWLQVQLVPSLHLG